MNATNRRVITLVMAHEGGYDAVNRNTDGAGVSVGIFQWAQRTGGLGQLLKAWHQADPALFRGIFGSAYRLLLRQTAEASMARVDGALLWEEPWVGRFVRAGREPVFQAIQDQLAEQGPYLQAAYKGAAILGLPTERTLAVLLDVAVTQGPENAVKVARAVQKRLAGQTLTVASLLETVLERSIAHFRASRQPPPPSSPHLSWVKVGPEWHKHAGAVNLYRTLLKRRSAYLDHNGLSDVQNPNLLA